MQILKTCKNITVPHMFISVDRREIGSPAKAQQNRMRPEVCPYTQGRTAIMEVEEEFGIKVHPIITVTDIHEYLKTSDVLGLDKDSLGLQSQAYPLLEGTDTELCAYPALLCFWRYQLLIAKAGDLAFLYEKATRPFYEGIRGLSSRVFVFVGPEGGFAPEGTG